MIDEAKLVRTKAYVNMIYYVKKKDDTLYNFIVGGKKPTMTEALTMVQNHLQDEDINILKVLIEEIEIEIPREELVKYII